MRVLKDARRIQERVSGLHAARTVILSPFPPASLSSRPNSFGGKFIERVQDGFHYSVVAVLVEIDKLVSKIFLDRVDNLILIYIRLGL